MLISKFPWRIYWNPKKLFSKTVFKVWIFWEGHKIWKNLQLMYTLCWFWEKKPFWIKWKWSANFMENILDWPLSEFLDFDEFQICKIFSNAIMHFWNNPSSAFGTKPKLCFWWLQTFANGRSSCIFHSCYWKAIQFSPPDGWIQFWHSFLILKACCDTFHIP